MTPGTVTLSSAGAMRAAENIVEAWRTTENMTVNRAAAIIDRETGLPEVCDVLELMLGAIADDAPNAEMRLFLAAKASTALANARGRPANLRPP